MKSSKLLVSLLFAAALPALALAQSEGAGDAGSVIDAFVSAPGYEAVDLENVDALVEASLPETGSVFTASGQLSPLAKAIRAVQTSDGQLDRARLQLGVSLLQADEPPAADPVTLVLVQLDRFNVGPSVHAELVRSVGEDQVAAIEEFGEGPHVSWRLVMRQLMGQQSALVAASRLEITNEEAALLECFGSACLQTAAIIPELTDWTDLTETDLETSAEGLAPAVFIDLLAELAFFDPYGHEAGMDAAVSPVLVATVLIETNLGQDLSTEGVLRVGELRDDSVEAIWQRLVAFPAADDSVMLLGAAAYDCRRGVSDDGLCL